MSKQPTVIITQCSSQEVVATKCTYKGEVTVRAFRCEENSLYLSAHIEANKPLPNITHKVWKPTSCSRYSRRRIRPSSAQPTLWMKSDVCSLRQSIGFAKRT